MNVRRAEAAPEYGTALKRAFRIPAANVRRPNLSGSPESGTALKRDFRIPAANVRRPDLSGSPEYGTALVRDFRIPATNVRRDIQTLTFSCVAPGFSRGKTRKRIIIGL